MHRQGQGPAKQRLVLQVQQFGKQVSAFAPVQHGAEDILQCSGKLGVGVNEQRQPPALGTATNARQKLTLKPQGPHLSKELNQPEDAGVETGPKDNSQHGGGLIIPEIFKVQHKVKRSAVPAGKGALSLTTTLHGDQSFKLLEADKTNPAAGVCADVTVQPDIDTSTSQVSVNVCDITFAVVEECLSAGACDLIPKPNLVTTPAVAKKKREPCACSCSK
ncbi:hypothetical protein NDU88_008029 [Pleurodeles waltl]|uniref:Uncharacterized protein n=1 Tax=Pleurodeles waltl TaxID=8319 RepID=A0AAV7VV64_PLEWA|nr:hypothetical protein NDU88_008029 [Pleurodeles waltl]